MVDAATREVRNQLLQQGPEERAHPTQEGPSWKGSQRSARCRVLQEAPTINPQSTETYQLGECTEEIFGLPQDPAREEQNGSAS